MTHKIEKTDAEWRALLAAKGAEPLAYEVTRHEATERAFSGRLANQFAEPEPERGLGRLIELGGQAGNRV